MDALKVLRETGLLIATSNQGKFKEMAGPWDEHGISTLSLRDIGSPTPEVEEIESSYEGNASLKARVYGEWSGLPALADDSGLEVMALGGLPGVRSARFAGENASDSDNLNKLLGLLEKETERKARYVSVLCLIIGPKVSFTSTAFLEGEIANAPVGRGGFGYDPVFLVAGQNRTLSELKENRIPVKTHRVYAMEKLLKEVKK